jgi:hypothetical protein
VPLLVKLAPFSVTGIADIAVDGRVLSSTLIISIVTAVLFAWAPVFETSRASLLSTLGRTAPTTAAGSVRTQGLLISLEIALAVLLLTAGGLMVKSPWHLQLYSAGFTPRGTYTMRVPLWDRGTRISVRSTPTSTNCCSVSGVETMRRSKVRFREFALLGSKHDRRIDPHRPACRNPRRHDGNEDQHGDCRCL